MSQNREAPAYQEYASNMLANIDFRKMSLQERGLLYTFRLECWVNHSIPSDSTELAKILGLTVDEVNESMPAVMSHFVRDGASICSPELRDYRTHIEKQRLKQSEGGRRGAGATNSKRKRKRKTKTTNDSDSATSTATPTRTPSASERLLSTVQSSTDQSKPVSMKEFSGNDFVKDYEDHELCTADAYSKATKGS